MTARLWCFVCGADHSSWY